MRCWCQTAPSPICWFGRVWSIAEAISWDRCLCDFMLARSDTGAGQPVALISTRMAIVLARRRPRRVLNAARKRERWTRNSQSRRPPAASPSCLSSAWTGSMASRYFLVSMVACSHRDTDIRDEGGDERNVRERLVCVKRTARRHKRAGRRRSDRNFRSTRTSRKKGK